MFTKNIAATVLLSALSIIGIEYIIGMLQEVDIPIPETIQKQEKQVKPKETSSQKITIDVNKFSLTGWLRIKKEAPLRGIDFSQAEKQNGCLYEIKYFESFPDNTRLQQMGWGPVSPIQILEKGEALRPNIPLDEFGEECLGGFNFQNNTLYFSPTQPSTPLNDLSISLREEIPIMADTGNVFWTYRKGMLLTRLRQSKIGSSDTVFLQIRLRYFGNANKASFVIIGKNRYWFEKEKNKILSVRIPLENKAMAYKLKLRINNYAIIEDITLSTEDITVSVLHQKVLSVDENQAQ